jgi:hypothetical protein
MNVNINTNVGEKKLEKHVNICDRIIVGETHKLY